MKKLLSILAFLMLTSTVFSADITENVSIYGFARLDCIYSSADVNHENFYMFAQPDNAVYGGESAMANEKYSENPTMKMSPAFSRMGIKLHNYDVSEGITMGGKLEFEWMGGFTSGTAAFQPRMSLRHAYGELTAKNWSLLFGQTFTLSATPFPNTAVPNAGFAYGNPWIRLPQVQFIYHTGAMKFAVSANRMISWDNTGFAGSEGNPRSDGDYSMLPIMMGRVWYNMDNVTISAYGHYGTSRAWENIDLSVENDVAEEHDIATWAGMADVGVKVKDFKFTAKAFYGQDLNFLGAGIYQGLQRTTTDVLPVVTMGGFATLEYKINKTWGVCLGYGMDDPEDTYGDDDEVTLTRTANTVAWANTSMVLGGKWKFILEGLYGNTKYENTLEYDAAEHDGNVIQVRLMSQFNF